jgi:hypothetical protein
MGNPGKDGKPSSGMIRFIAGGGPGFSLTTAFSVSPLPHAPNHHEPVCGCDHATAFCTSFPAILFYHSSSISGHKGPIECGYRS